MKHLLSSEIKARIKQYIRQSIDFVRLDLKFAKERTNKIKFEHLIQLSQPLIKNKGSESKIHNINLSIKRIESIIIFPNEIFSFWKNLPQPTLQNGYKLGRTINEGKLSESIGGGLCQLGGLIYHISLLANLKIIERHNHSLDLYTDDSRYSPLGADAAVSYGHLDLRIKNTTNYPLKYNFIIEKDKITIKLLSYEPIKKSKLEFILLEVKAKKIVKTFVNDICINTSTYKNMT